MSPLFNFNRKYPKALSDLARETDRLSKAEDDMAKAMLEAMRESDAEPSRGPSRPQDTATTNPKDRTRR